jgi:hypothetical protein
MRPIATSILNDFDLLLYLEMPGPRSSNTYTCTCTHFCGGHKAGLSRATYYRHSPYRDAAQPTTTSGFSTSFQSFLDNSAGGQGNTGDLEAGVNFQDQADQQMDLDQDHPEMNAMVCLMYSLFQRRHLIFDQGDQGDQASQQSQDHLEMNDMVCLMYSLFQRWHLIFDQGDQGDQASQQSQDHLEMNDMVCLMYSLFQRWHLIFDQGDQGDQASQQSQDHPEMNDMVCLMYSLFQR